MDKVNSRFNHKLIFILFALSIASYLLSFLLLQIATIFLSLLYLFEKMTEKRKGLNSFLKYFALFGIVRLLSIFTSEYFDLSIVAVQREILFYLTLFSFSYYLKMMDKDYRDALVKIFLAAGILVAIIGFLIFIFYPIQRAQSITSGYHTFADYLVVIFIMLLAYKPSRKEYYYWIVGTAFTLNGVLISLGRVSAALAIGALFLIWFLFRLKWKSVAMIVGLTTILSLFSFKLNDAGFIENRVANPSQLSDRDILYSGFFELAEEHPLLGFGPRTFREIFPLLNEMKDEKVGSWHNDLIQIYIESGVFLLILYLIIWGKYFLMGWKIFRSQNSTERETGIGIFLGLGSLFITGLTSSVIFSPVLYLLIAFLIPLFVEYYLISTSELKN
ncbi:MAG: O-antigen ligase family protein [Melioribacteraceae bacterium]|nr:O-antigen ligase family protein [Melioribacteraceae bacterium]